jgi:hypothetical protein
MTDKDKSLPNNVVPFGRNKEQKDTDDEKKKEDEVNLEEQNKERYAKLQEEARRLRTDSNRNVTRSYNLTPRNPDRRK